MEKYPQIKIKDGKKYFYRFTLNQRIQHLILAITVVLLVLTGMPLKFSDASWAPYLYALFGGIKYAPIVHKVNGAILMTLFFYHIFYLIYVIRKYYIDPIKASGEAKRGSSLKAVLTQKMVPNLKDARDIRDLMKYLFFLTNKRPDGDNFTWKEKFDYWAPFWGMVIIGFSGLILWSKEIATQILPGWFLNFSLIAHSDEALLAALFLFIWHWYNVHFSISVFPMGTVFLTGYLSEDLMVEEHYQYYVEVMKKAGLEHEILPPHGAHEQESHEGGAVS
ncbi:MAG: cytochrome b/b6 domain-containing protein [Nitrospiraceae bacterium]|nr:MAG: cytochrome b/b6 domain-containing protein [Nitrospiraceae bacterium]